MDHICEDVVRKKPKNRVFFWDKNREFSCFVQPGLPGLIVDTYVSWFLGVWDNNVEWEKALMTSKHYWFLWCNVLISKNDGLRQWKGWHPIYEMENKSHVWNHQAVIINHY